MVYKRLWREFPAFTVYVCVHALAVPLRLALRSFGSYKAWFVSYWISEAIAAVISFWLVYEIYLHVFQRYEGLRSLGSVLLQWSAAILALLAVVAGTTTGMLLANVPAVFLGHVASDRIPFKAVRIVSAAVFAALGVATLAG